MVSLLCSGIARAQEIAVYKGNAKAAISYTFDDGLLEHYSIVFPKLRGLGIKATFWIIGQNVDNRKVVRGASAMTWDMIKEMCEDGQEMSSHTYSHANMTKLDSTEWAHEIEKNDSAIFSHTGVHALTLAFPGNKKSDSLLSYIDRRSDIIASRNFQTSMGGKFASGQSSDQSMNPFDELLQKALKKGSWIVTMTHGIYNGYDCFVDDAQVQRFWKHLDEAKALADKGELWIAPFKDIATYMNGKSVEVTYILGDNKPKSVKQGKRKLTSYQSWDGKWCVDGERTKPLKVKM